ncbi:glycosyltransferase family 2 protein [Limnohabitans sp. DM1]|uniref:glycosyltransferase family 2 protein n=1 Tax=Limnohabitans sp. DM1 TaxID=1597955 RepID=UPI000AECA329|nr:glycosyltransferase [Limnohabitans sp. DM1]
MKLGYVCTNFNNSHFTVDAVRSLAASSDDCHELRVVVVDNLSTPEHRATLHALASEFSCVDLILNDENVGYFPGLNCGIRHMRSKYPDFEYFVIGNNDLVFAPEFCSQVEDNRDLLDSHAVVSPDIVTLDGEHQNPHVIRTISKTREIVYDVYYSNYHLAQLILWFARKSKRLTDRSDELHYENAQYIYQGHGSCYLLGPKFFADFEELWAPTFLMGEEYFLSKQLSDRGLRVYYSPTIQVTHCWHGSLQSIPSRKLWQLAREAHLVYRKYINPFNML